MFSPRSRQLLQLHRFTGEGNNVKKQFRDFHSENCGGGSSSSTARSSRQRPLPSDRFPMLMNVARACPLGWGGSALNIGSSPNQQQKQSDAKQNHLSFDGHKLIASAFESHWRALQQQKTKNDHNTQQIVFPTNYIYHDDQCMVVPDAHPKSTFHFLLLPRYSYAAAAAAAGAGATTTTARDVSPSSSSMMPMSIADVQQKHLHLLRRMDSVCAEIVKAVFQVGDDDDGDDVTLLLEKMLDLSSHLAPRSNFADSLMQEKREYLQQWIEKPRSLQMMQQQQQQSQPKNLCLLSSVTKLRFMSGFHSLPSLAPLHMHLTSLDMISDSLKKKKHYNTFTTPFFQSRAGVEEQLRVSGYVRQAVDEDCLERNSKFENQALVCAWCQAPMTKGGVQELKQHLVGQCHANGCYFMRQQSV